MSMYDTVYAEMECPFCGQEYRYTPMSWNEAEQKARDNKRWQLKIRQKNQREEISLMSSMQSLWASMSGFKDVDAWIS